MKTCKGCKWAEWKKTSAGNLHPSGDGACTFPIKLPVTPLAFRWGWAEKPPTPYGGRITRRIDFKDHCPCYTPEGS